LAGHAFLLLSFVLIPVVAGQSNGVPSTPGLAIDEVTVEGRVVDNHGVPVANAQVGFFPYGAFAGVLPGAITATDGTFVFRMQPLGEGAISAWKLEVGFPNARWAIYGNEDRPNLRKINATVAVSPIHVELSFEDPDAIVEWKVLSKADQSPVRSARYDVTWSDDPKTYLRGGVSNIGIFKFVLPQHPVLIKIGAPGFRDWTSADSWFGGPVLLKPGTKDERTILLEPAK
jgi:hypothetical protein